MTDIKQLTKNDLNKTLKQLSKSSATAIAYLTKVVTDEEQDTKVRTEAAKILLDRHVDVAKEVSKQSLTMILAEARLKALPSGMRDVTGAGQQVVVDFGSVQKVEGIDYRELEDNNVFDMSDIGEIPSNKED